MKITVLSFAGMWSLGGLELAFEVGHIGSACRLVAESGTGRRNIVRVLGSVVLLLLNRRILRLDQVVY